MVGNAHARAILASFASSEADNEALASQDANTMYTVSVYMFLWKHMYACEVGSAYSNPPYQRGKYMPRLMVDEWNIRFYVTGKMELWRRKYLTANGRKKIYKHIKKNQYLREALQATCDLSWYTRSSPSCQAFHKPINSIIDTHFIRTFIRICPRKAIDKLSPRSLSEYHRLKRSPLAISLSLPAGKGLRKVYTCLIEESTRRRWLKY